MAKQNIYSVGQVNSYIKDMFDQDFMLKHISLRGEVSNCKYHSAGHIYFALKDETGTISCVMFAGNRKGLAFSMEEGQKVIVTGRISVYQRDGSYQLYAEKIILDGVGQLYLKFEALKNELLEMGMFAEEYKQPIPSFASKIGIVTAPTGAAVRDIIQISKRRNPYVQLILCPALVQGEGAADSIVKGINTLDKMGLDIIIVGRGGGSIEDLWAFNEEKVARAVFECSTPIISAVGHETDTTIIDYVADLRAPTPSAAAELAVFEYDKLKSALDTLKTQLDVIINQKLSENKNRYMQYQMRLKYVSPMEKFHKQKERYDLLKEKLVNLINQKLLENKNRLSLNCAKFEALSPIKKLSSGYSYATVNNKALISIKQVKEEDIVKINVSDGEIDVAVISKKEIEREVF